MKKNRFSQALAAWTACFAVLLASLAPAISHFIAAPASPFVIVDKGDLAVKSVHRQHEGMGYRVEGELARDKGLDEHAHGSGHHSPALHFEHCPFCFTHAGSFGLPPSVFPSLPVVKSPIAVAALFYLWPRQSVIWIAAQARAPPSFS